MSNETPWTSVKFEYDANGMPVYIGKHKTIGASVNDAGWYVWKIVEDASGNASLSGPVIGQWSARTTLL